MSELRKVENWYPPPEITDPYAAKLLDEVLTLFSLYRNEGNMTTVQDALDYIKLAARQHPRQPITMSLARMFDEQEPGWLG